MRDPLRSICVGGLMAGLVALAIVAQQQEPATQAGAPANATQGTPAQASTASDIEALLASLAAKAAAFREHLPSVACHEHITSQNMEGGKVTHSKEVDDQLRVLRPNDAKQTWQEQRVPLRTDGTPQEGKHIPAVPYRVTDGFFTGQSLFTEPDHVRCLDFGLEPSGSYRKLTFRQKQSATSDATCPHRDDGLAGYVLVDRVTGEIAMIYRTVPETTSTQFNRARMVEIRYVPVPFESQTFSLPQRIYSQNREDQNYTAVYSGCKRFASSARILDVNPAN